LKTRVQVFAGLAGITALMFVAAGVARAGTKKFKATTSGTGLSVPIDLDSDSCFTAANGATVCTDTSQYDVFAGTKSPGGGFAGQNVVEVDGVPGSGCNILGTIVPGIASCTLAGSSEQGCELEVVGGSEVQRDNSSGDLLFLTFTPGTSSTVCLDLSSGPPFNSSISTTQTITGGTGKNAGATGTVTGIGHGQVLTVDAAFHGLSWFVSNSTGTITTP
jgi:hypothetical protein